MILSKEIVGTVSRMDQTKYLFSYSDILGSPTYFQPTGAPL